jgi:hypothetical protein
MKNGRFSQGKGAFFYENGKTT